MGNICGWSLLCSSRRLASSSSLLRRLLLVLLSVPVEARSRMMSLLSVCIGMSPVGLLHLGLMAEYVEPHIALTIIALEGLAAIALTIFLIPSVRR